jgi:hypothetical protein
VRALGEAVRVLLEAFGELPEVQNAIRRHEIAFRGEVRLLVNDV